MGASNKFPLMTCLRAGRRTLPQVTNREHGAERGNGGPGQLWVRGFAGYGCGFKTSPCCVHIFKLNKHLQNSEDAYRSGRRCRA